MAERQDLEKGSHDLCGTQLLLLISTIFLTQQCNFPSATMPLSSKIALKSQWSSYENIQSRITAALSKLPQNQMHFAATMSSRHLAGIRHLHVMIRDHRSFPRGKLGQQREMNQTPRQCILSEHWETEDMVHRDSAWTLGKSPGTSALTGSKEHLECFQDVLFGDSHPWSRTKGPELLNLTELKLCSRNLGNF